MLSDKIKAVTKAIGVEPCAGCQKRAATLDQWERRGFIKTGALAFLGLKNSMLKLAWRAAGATIPVSVPEALGFIRTLNTIQTVWRNSHGGKHTTLPVLFGPEGILQVLGTFNPGTPAYGWASRFNPALCYYCKTLEAQQNGSACPSPPKDGSACNCSHNEVLPGWTLDYAAVTDNYPRLAFPEDSASLVQDGYRLVLKSNKYCLITDDGMIIYEAKTPSYSVPAAGLERAELFPGAIAHNLFRDNDETTWNRIKRLLTPTTVYAQGFCCGLGLACPNCSGGCQPCVSGCCCSVTCTVGSAPIHQCICNVGCTGCLYIGGPCTTANCYCCASQFFGSTCFPNLCCFQGCNTCPTVPNCA